MAAIQNGDEGRSPERWNAFLFSTISAMIYSLYFNKKSRFSEVRSKL